MTDERGGRYFREARFFLAGDKVAAQSHILEARSLMGYMRDMHALGGPPIQVKYATLQDGTRIKATMMNGQYQAEIISPSVVSSSKPERVLTIVGTDRSTYLSRAIKWQARTGLVTLPLGGYVYSEAQQVSYDGSMVYGLVYGPGADPNYPGGRIDTYECVWVGDAEPVVLRAYGFEPAVVDIEYGDTGLIEVPHPTDVSWDLYRHKFINGDNRYHLFYGSYGGDVGVIRAAAIERGAVAEDEVLTLYDTAPINGTSMVYGASASGNTLVGNHPKYASPEPDQYQIGVLAIWERPTATDSYVARDIPGMFSIGAPSVSDDGRTVLAEVERVRFTNGSWVSDTVPAIWTEEYGILKLIEFTEPPPVAQIQLTYGIKIASDGTAAIGAWGSYLQGGWAMAWTDIDVVNGSFTPIPELSYMQYVELTDIN